MINTLLALLLSGNVSNSPGCIGVRVGSFGTHGISRVVKNSPADLVGIKKGDIFLSANGINNINAIDGDSGTLCRVKIKRGDTYLEFDVIRKPIKEVYGRQLVKGKGPQCYYTF